MLMRDDQRRAMFANMFNVSNRFARIPSYISDDIVVSNLGENESSLFKKSIVSNNIKLPQGTQAIFMIRDFGNSSATKNLAIESAEVLTSGDMRAEAVPLWDGDSLVGHATVAWGTVPGKQRVYEEIASDSGGDLRVVNTMVKEAPPKIIIKKVYVDRKPVLNEYDMLNSELHSAGVSDGAINEIVENEKFVAAQKEYYNNLLGAFEKSGSDDFERFKKKYDVEYVGMKFSKKAKVQKKDFDAIYENLDGDYTCSYCGGVFGDKMTAASHAWNCNKNAFNDGNEFTLDNDTTQSFDI